ncbi:MAG TPA: peroxiredoxin [Pirellulales bacterium]|nr:peroxiredoxin [Pirellulales bacterium]
MTLLALAAGLFASNQAMAQLKVGDAAPSFESTGDDGKTWKSADHVGKKIIVVYFYPADFTGGCTKQACAYRDDFKKLSEKGVEVVGVSGDTVKTHGFFKKEHNLPFTLLADEEGAVAKKFGAPVNVNPASATVKIGGAEQIVERGATIKRWTFVIGKDGKIAYIDNKVNAAEDSKKIAEVVDKLSK